MTRAELIAKLEAAKTGSRELDAEIVVALRIMGDLPEWADKNFPVWRARNGRAEVVHTNGDGGLSWAPARYTTSLDAALKLVPEGWQWQVSNRANEPHRGRAYLHTDELIFIDAGQLRNPKYRGSECTAATPALALCIASLKARG